MPKFKYEARDKQGKLIHGFLEGSSESSVAKELIHQGISPLTIAEETEKKKGGEIHFPSKLKIGYPKLQDLAFFSRQMYSLTHAGVPIVKALNVVKESSKNEILKMALKNVVEGVEAGASLATSLRRHSDIFPNIMIELVNVGENTGSLDTIFQQIAVHFERELTTRTRIKTATRYPLILLVVIIIAFIIINVIVIPAFAKFFKQFKIQLPLPTRILVGISDFTMANWHFIVLAIVMLVIGTWYYVNTPEGKYRWDRAKLKIPIFGDIMFRTLLGRFSRAFSLCHKTGVPLLNSIDLISKAIDNVYVGEKISNMKTDIEHGSSITNAAINSQMFSPLVIQMLSIGEETGEINRLLDDMAVYYEESVDYDVKRLGDLLEPIILLFLGAVVLLLALGVYLPMWDISRAATGR